MSLNKTAVCAVSGEILPVQDLIRFVIRPDNVITPDLTHKLPGVFLWVKADRSTLKKAIWRNSFAAITKQAVSIPENLLEIIENGLTRLALQNLSLMKRAGELVSGFMKTEEVLRSQGAAAYVVASDAKENGREKLERLAVAHSIPVIDYWSSAELSSALGDENIMHLALAQGGLMQKHLEILTTLKAVKSEK